LVANGTSEELIAKPSTSALKGKIMKKLLATLAILAIAGPAAAAYTDDVTVNLTVDSYAAVTLPDSLTIACNAINSAQTAMEGSADLDVTYWTNHVGTTISFAATTDPKGYLTVPTSLISIDGSTNVIGDDITITDAITISASVPLEDGDAVVNGLVVTATITTP